MARDPICLADVDEAGATNEGLVTQYNKQTFFFCSHECMRRFEHEPDAFVGASEWESTDDERTDYYFG